ncbi:4'-phosphopantetheinyl transferase superfamily protein [Chelatococcus sp. SYSU_G07232]|uniref:4'-phosphopantetheinyl transferase superfamily protein n=1 Tax=Chelatococcus albus TaxID=3047466 RepID=A0ABT7ADF5_9HYPH|nr:4'-phosphopantetheinyl transferase superfamily protein [Chelatococcus sp. SYSU_G07232]MDJ1157411.1 4'-phosphopantetheinyl transferase superfamily protein [Chelatococcus sp. SYSU_G07232]
MRLWQIDLIDPAYQAPECLAWLDAAERDRCRRFLRADDARRFAAAHVGLRLVLARHLGLDPREIAFSHNAWGRPFVAGGPPFSMSHSGEVALVAVGGGGILGVDIEGCEQPVERRWFDGSWTTGEERRLTPVALSDRHLLRLWTRKEAAVKALGRGLSQPLTDVAVPLAEDLPPQGGRLVIRAEGRLFLWYCYDIPLGGGSVASLASDRPAAVAALRCEMAPAPTDRRLWQAAPGHATPSARRSRSSAG